MPFGCPERRSIEARGFALHFIRGWIPSGGKGSLLRTVHVHVYAATFAPGNNSPPDRNYAVAPTRVLSTIGESVSTLMRRMALALVRATARKGEIVKPARVDRTDPRFKERCRDPENRMTTRVCGVQIMQARKRGLPRVGYFVSRVSCRAAYESKPRRR